MTSEAVEELELVLCVGDTTTYLDYGKIKAKREGSEPTGNGGNGLILHSSLAIDPQNGQSMGLMWQKLCLALLSTTYQFLKRLSFQRLHKISYSWFD